MPRVTIDTTEAVSFEATEPGPYPMRVERVDITKSKEKEGGGGGEPMLDVYFKFDDPALDKKCGHVRRNYMLAGKGASFTREFLKATTGQDFPVGMVLDFDTDDIVSKPVIVQITDKPSFHDKNRLENEAERVTAAA